jgi:hypothetical protein
MDKIKATLAICFMLVIMSCNIVSIRPSLSSVVSATTMPTTTYVDTLVPSATPRPTQTVVIQTETPVNTAQAVKPYLECSENGEGVICFGDYFNELPESSYKNVKITPLYIILHTDDAPGDEPTKWFSYRTWYGLAGRDDGGRSVHFSVGLDGVGQFLRMYEKTVVRCRGSGEEYNPKTIQIEMSGRNYNYFITGENSPLADASIVQITSTTIDLVIRLMKQYNIPFDHVLGHYQVMDGRTDPGDRYFQEYFLPLLKAALEDTGTGY